MKTIAAVTALMVFATVVAGTSKYLGEIECGQDSRISGCEPLDECTVTCPSPCSNPGSSPEFWGTGLYSYDVKVCRSAVHDYRIPSYASNYNVTYIRRVTDPEKYLPTIQRGIVSTVYGKLSYSKNGIFTFSSPYITEDILDVSTLNFLNLYQPSAHFNQECYINDKTKCHDLDFEFYIPNKYATDNGVTNAAGGKEMWWTYQVQPGGFWCNLINNTYSSVMSLAMPSDADFLPDQWTQTINVNETVRIKFTQKQSGNSSADTIWKKDQKELYSFPNMKLSQTGSEYYLDIENAQTGDAGVYSLEVKENTLKQGIMRLIVRRCPKDYFGSKCDQQCPICQNGGVCHDVMGTCICAPGFNGPNCENTCTNGYFGQSCSQSCANSKNAVDNTCKSALICLPDPYGCSCAAGYKGFTCDQACSSGDSGAGCGQTGTSCHCAGNQACPGGSCPSGCAEGWKSDTTCDTSYPYLRNQPTLQSAEPDQLQIQFDSWDESQLGSGKPQSYVVEYKELNSSCNDWTTANTIDATSISQAKGGNIETLENLRPGTRYAIRVIVQDQDGHAQRELAPTAIYWTSEYFGEIDCNTEVRDTRCVPPPKQCTFTCKSACSTPGTDPEMWGTRIYSYDVKICRAAVHDYRMESFSSNSNVTLIRSSNDPEKYLPTIQQGIVSKVFKRLGYRSNAGHYVFSTPYITEDILDVATLNFKYLYQPSGNFTQACLITGETKDLDFEFYIPKTATDNGVTSSGGGKEVTWTDTNLQPGGYWCNLINNTYSDVMSLAMASDADFAPDQWTLTTSINETVRIKFTKNSTDTSSTDVQWRKDQEELYSFPNMKLSESGSEYYIDIENVDVGDGGIYSLEIKDRKEKQGIMRLIVRRCTKDNFGPLCNQKCPTCQNGGVCHDVMGTCICAPGFSGTNCETACKADSFGQSCTQSCSSSQHVVDKLNPCKNALICLPDPYGCSCAAGYTGLQCDGGTNSGEDKADTGDKTPKGTDTGSTESNGKVEDTTPTPEDGGSVKVLEPTPTPKDEGAGTKEKDLATTVESTIQDLLKSKSFNPYSIPNTQIPLGLKKATFSEGQAWNMQNLKLTATPTLTEKGNDRILTLRIGGNDLYATGKLSNYGPFGIDPLGKVPIRADVQFVDTQMTIQIPKDKNSAPKLQHFETLKLEGVKVQGGGLPVIQGILNFLTGFFNTLFPSVFEGVIKSILPELTANLVEKLRF